MRRIVAAAAFGIAFLAGQPASAQLAIDHLWLDFNDANASRADIVIRNESKDRYYITVAPAEIQDPGADTEKRVEEADPEKLGILVTPNRLILDPQGMRSIRVVSLNTHLDKDRIYRIKISPEIGDIQTDAKGPEDRGIAIKMLAAYDVLVTVRPKDGKAQIAASRTDKELVIRNSGNTNTLLFAGKACPAKADAATASPCEDIGARRLYAGNSWTIPLKSPDVKVDFKERKSSGSDGKDVSF
jgi:P pilus assembly chaperone PapD